MLVSRSETLDALESADLAQFEEVLALSPMATGSDDGAANRLGGEDNVTVVVACVVDTA